MAWQVLAYMRATDTHLGKTTNLAPAVEVTAHAAQSNIYSLLTAAENEHKSAKCIFSLLTTEK